MLALSRLSKNYRATEVETCALNDVSLTVEQGEFVAVMGPSGCGKSTLLNILGLLDRPSAGSYRLMGEEIAGRGEQVLTRLRRDHIGFVFQSFNLIDDLTVEENVEVSLIYRKDGGRDANAWPRRWSGWAWRTALATGRSNFWRPAAACRHRTRVGVGAAANLGR